MSAHALALNGTLLMLAGLVVGTQVATAPYPRLMLSAHIQFLVNGMMSVIAAMLLATGLSKVAPAGLASGALLLGHLALWVLCFSEVAGAFWGTKEVLPIAAHQAGAPGSDAAWQEQLVTACHVGPAVLLLLAWGVLVQGVVAAGWASAKARKDA